MTDPIKQQEQIVALYGQVATLWKVLVVGFLLQAVGFILHLV